MPRDRLKRWMIVAAPAPHGTARCVVCVNVRTEEVARQIAAGAALLAADLELDAAQRALYGAEEDEETMLSMREHRNRCQQRRRDILAPFGGAP